MAEKALRGQNGLIREKYVTIQSARQDDYRAGAGASWLKRAEDIADHLFKRMGSTVHSVSSGVERLSLLQGITRPGMRT